MFKMTTLALASAVFSAAAYAQQPEVPVNLPAFKEGQYVHQAPTLDDLMNDQKMNPELRKVILRGRDIFMNTQKSRGK